MLLQLQRPPQCCQTQGRRLHRREQSWQREREQQRVQAHPLVPGLELAAEAARHRAQQELPPGLQLQALRPQAYYRRQREHRRREHRRPALAR